MTRDLMLSMLRAGDNGEQILQILDTLSDAADDDAADDAGTLQEIQF
jgi:hypothetical protein